MEILDKLLAEADRRGFNKIGTKFLSIHSDDGKERVIDYYDRDSPISWYLCSGTALRSKDGLYNRGTCSNPAIYENGKWCPIICNDNYKIY